MVLAPLMAGLRGTSIELRTSGPGWPNSKLSLLSNSSSGMLAGLFSMGLGVLGGSKVKRGDPVVIGTSAGARASSWRLGCLAKGNAMELLLRAIRARSRLDVFELALAIDADERRAPGCLKIGKGSSSSSMIVSSVSIALELLIRRLVARSKRGRLFCSNPASGALSVRRCSN